MRRPTANPSPIGTIDVTGLLVPSRGNRRRSSSPELVQSTRPLNGLAGDGEAGVGIVQEPSRVSHVGDETANCRRCWTGSSAYDRAVCGPPQIRRATA